MPKGAGLEMSMVPRVSIMPERISGGVVDCDRQNVGGAVY